MADSPFTSREKRMMINFFHDFAYIKYKYSMKAELVEESIEYRGPKGEGPVPKPIQPRYKSQEEPVLSQEPIRYPVQVPREVVPEDKKPKKAKKAKKAKAGVPFPRKKKRKKPVGMGHGPRVPINVEYFNECLTKSGLDIQQVADSIGASRSGVRGWLKGTDPEEYLFVRIVETFKCDPYRLADSVYKGKTKKGQPYEGRYSKVQKGQMPLGYGADLSKLSLEKTLAN